MPNKKTKPKLYSHSRLSTFEQCPFKFKLRYLDKIQPEIEKTIEMHLGTAVHEALEWLYENVMNKKIPTLDELITTFAAKWQDTYTDDTLIVKKQLSAKDYFNKGVQFLLDYYNTHAPFDDNTIETEKKIIIYLDDEGEYKIQGFIDRLVYNPETGEYEIHDYKTANNLPLKENIETDRQLALYSIAIKDAFGYDKNVVLVWHYLAHGQKICSRRTNEQLAQLKAETLELIKEIEATTEFPTCKSVLCDWCEYKSMCPEFGGEVPEIEEQDELGIFSPTGEGDSSGEGSGEDRDDEELGKEEMMDIY